LKTAISDTHQLTPALT